MNERVMVLERRNKKFSAATIMPSLAGTGSQNKVTVETAAGRVFTDAENGRLAANAAPPTALKFVGENILQPDFQFHKNRFQFVQREMMLAVVDAKQSLMGNAGFFCKFRIRQAASLLFQKFRQLFVEFALHDLQSGKKCITYA
jgi:hypothetical protein